jgi:hypothetical protein
MGIAGERRQKVPWHVDIVRLLAVVELRLAQEPASISHHFENTVRFDSLGGDRSATSLLVGGAGLVRHGAILPGSSFTATRTPALALTAASAAATTPTPAASTRTAATILGIARLAGALLPWGLVAVRALAIGWLGRRGVARGSLARAAAPLLRSSRSGTGGPAVFPSMVVSQGLRPFQKGREGLSPYGVTCRR